METRNLLNIFQELERSYANGKVLGYHIILECLPSGESRLCSNIFPRSLKIRQNAENEVVIRDLLPWTKYNLTISLYNKAGNSPSSSLERKTLEDSK